MVAPRVSMLACRAAVGPRLLVTPGLAESLHAVDMTLGECHYEGCATRRRRHHPPLRWGGLALRVLMFTQFKSAAGLRQVPSELISKI